MRKKSIKTNSLTKEQVAKVYKDDLIKHATTPERKIKSLLFLINKNITPLQFIFQHPWTNTPTREFYISDFYFPSLEITLEIDGKSHNNKLQKQKDTRKEAFLTSLGIKTIRITNGKTRSMNEVSMVKLLKLSVTK